MKSVLFRLATVAALATLVACSGNSSSNAAAIDNTAAAANNAAPSDNAASTDNSAASPAAAAADPAMTSAFQKLTAAEDNGFTDVMADKATDDADATYYFSKVNITDMKCAITISKKSTDKIATCAKQFANQADADAAYAAAKQTAVTGLPDLKPSDTSAATKYIASYFAQSDKQTVLVYEQKKGAGFQVGIGFAGPAFYKTP
jgi:hypothetical protein